MNFFREGLQKLSLSSDIKNHIDEETIFLIENVGIPKKIVYSEIDFQTPYINAKYLEFGKDKNMSEILYGIELDTKNIVTYGGENNKYFSFINQNLQSLLTASSCNDFFVKRLVLSSALGAYYDNSSSGGNFQKYANLLKELIRDIDSIAVDKGSWNALIEEMSIGAI